MSKQISDLKADVAAKEGQLTAAAAQASQVAADLEVQSTERQKLEQSVQVGCAFCSVFVCVFMQMHPDALVSSCD